MEDLQGWFSVVPKFVYALHRWPIVGNDPEQPPVVRLRKPNRPQRQGVVLRPVHRMDVGRTHEWLRFVALIAFAHDTSPSAPLLLAHVAFERLLILP